MLFDKLMVEIEDHFKRRLLLVADGTFDGVYSHRFKWSNFKSCSSICKSLIDTVIDANEIIVHASFSRLLF